MAGEEEKDITRLSGKTMGADSKGTLVYPLDIGPDNFYPESIKFTVFQRTSANWENVKTKLADAVTTLENQWNKDTKQERNMSGAKIPLTKSQKEKQEFLESIKSGKLIDKGLRALGEIADYLKNETMGGAAFEGVQDILSEATHGLNQRTIETAEQLGSTYLNMPNEITFAEDINWEGTDIGMVGALAKNQGEAVPAGALSNFGSLVGGGTGALIGMLHKSIGPGAGAVLGTLGGTNAQRGLEASFGNIGNPYKEMTFSGIGFRQFSFNFVFRARNDTEVAMIRKIIERFRFYSKPTYNDKFGSAILNYPQEFLIEFLIKPEKDFSPIALENNKRKKRDIDDRFETNPHIPQIKMCVCKNVTTNYTSQNTWRALKNGHPVEISLALTFEETELVTGEDVIGQTQVGRFKTRKGRF